MSAATLGAGETWRKRAVGSRGARRPPLLVLLFALVLGGCATAVDNVLTDLVSAPASEVAARSGADPMPGDAQTLMTRLRPQQPGDAVYAAHLASEVSRTIARYRDVDRAIADGYRSFPPEPAPGMRLVHYVDRKRSQKEAKQMDPAMPGALLYEQVRPGRLRLVGAMFTAPVQASLEELNERVPLSVTQWHLHQNICVPRPIWDKKQWARTAHSGKPLFGPGSPVATEAACGQLGGRFLPTVFGWMAHVYVYADDPADVWNAMYGHDAGGGHGHPGH